MEPLIQASADIRGRFFDLVESLSAIRVLLDLDPPNAGEDAFLSEALTALMENQALEYGAIFVQRGGKLEQTAERSWEGERGPRAQSDGSPGVGRQAPRLLQQALIHRALESGEAQYAGVGERGTVEPFPGCGAVACLPIVHHGEALGVLSLYHGDPGYFEPWRVHLLDLYSALLGKLVLTHRLVNQMEAAVRERTQRLEGALREAQQLKLRYEQLSNIDELTGLHNRRFFFPVVETVLARSIRYGHAFSLLVMDLDSFKQINDSYGHAMGDEVLRDVAQAMRTEVREGDILARFGGEEFVVAATDTELDGARLLAERILARIRALAWKSGSRVIRVTASIGVSSLELFRQQQRKPLLDQLLQEADEALYACKGNGRNQIRIYGQHDRRPAVNG